LTSNPDINHQNYKLRWLTLHKTALVNSRNGSAMMTGLTGS